MFGGSSEHEPWSASEAVPTKRQSSTKAFPRFDLLQLPKTPHVNPQSNITTPFVHGTALLHGVKSQSSLSSSWSSSSASSTNEVREGQQEGNSHPSALVPQSSKLFEASIEPWRVTSKTQRDDVVLTSLLSSDQSTSKIAPLTISPSVPNSPQLISRAPSSQALASATMVDGNSSSSLNDNSMAWRNARANPSPNSSSGMSSSSDDGRINYPRPLSAIVDTTKPLAPEHAAKARLVSSRNERHNCITSDLFQQAQHPKHLPIHSMIFLLVVLSFLSTFCLL